MSLSPSHYYDNDDEDLFEVRFQKVHLMPHRLKI